jgi:hypothetical protein
VCLPGMECVSNSFAGMECVSNNITAVMKTETVNLQRIERGKDRALSRLCSFHPRTGHEGREGSRDIAILFI